MWFWLRWGVDDDLYLPGARRGRPYERKNFVSECFSVVPIDQNRPSAPRWPSRGPHSSRTRHEIHYRGRLPPALAPPPIPPGARFLINLIKK